MSKKTFIIDTNVLLSDTNAIYAFEENNVIIPLAVLEELDTHKSRQDEVGKNARVVSRQLDELRKLGKLQDGVKLHNGGTLQVLATDSDAKLDLPGELSCTKVDNIIIAFVHQMNKRGTDCILVSKDVNVRIKCDSLGINAEDYLAQRVVDTKEEMYGGVSRVTLPQDEIDFFFQGVDTYLPEEVLSKKTFYPNEILVIKDSIESKSAIARFIAPDKPIKKITSTKDVFGLTPRNKEQIFALDLLLDDSIKLVSLTGVAGCGKTCLCVAAGLQQVLGNNAKYDKLIISRPVQPLGRDIGFLPGTLEEKMEPWIAPIKDNLDFLMGNKKSPKGQSGNKIKSYKDGDDRVATFKRDPYLDRLFEEGKIEVEAITYIRGRSIPRAFIIIDEVQNLSMHELKTIITRCGEGTKIVLTGDIEQIDNVHVDVFTNGLTYAAEKFKEYAIAGHINLIRGERSALASLASKIL